MLYSKLGLVSGNSAGKREYGCKGNFLIGARNDQNTDIRVGVDGEGMDEVFLTVGEALAGAISNDDISEFLYQRAFVNVTPIFARRSIFGVIACLYPNGFTKSFISSTAKKIIFGCLTV